MIVLRASFSHIYGVNEGLGRVKDEDPLKPSFFWGAHMLKPYPDHDSSIGGVPCIFFDCFEESCDVWVLSFGLLSTVKTEIRRHFKQAHKSYSNSTQRSHHFLFDQKKNHIFCRLWISLIVFDISPNVNLRPPDLKTVMLEMTVVSCNLSFQGMIPRGFISPAALQENDQNSRSYLHDWLFQTSKPPEFGVKLPSSARLVLPLKNCWTAQAVDKECPAVAQATCGVWQGLSRTNTGIQPRTISWFYRQRYRSSLRVRVD